MALDQISNEVSLQKMTLKSAFALIKSCLHEVTSGLDDDTRVDILCFDFVYTVYVCSQGLIISTML